MKELECNTCGESTYLLERGEVQVRELPEGEETPMDHLERTGHEPRAPPEREQRKCNECGNVWWYEGSSDRPTCPNCKGKNNEPTDPDATYSTTFDVETNTQFRGQVEQIRGPYEAEFEYIADTGAGQLFISRVARRGNEQICEGLEEFDLDDDGGQINNDYRDLKEWCRDDFEKADNFLVDAIRRYRDQ